jgi:hypothetical protein
VLAAKNKPTMLHRDDCSHADAGAKLRDATPDEVKSLPECKSCWSEASREAAAVAEPANEKAA